MQQQHLASTIPGRFEVDSDAFHFLGLVLRPPPAPRIRAIFAVCTVLSISVLLALERASVRYPLENPCARGDSAGESDREGRREDAQFDF
jgi:hypothetical protein